MELISQDYIASQTKRPSTDGWYHLVIDFMRTKASPRLTREGVMWEKRLYEQAIRWPFK
jgi:hypothetical protein